MKVSKRGSRGILVRIGDVFGLRIVVAPAEPTVRGAKRWLVRCRCGAESVTCQSGLRRGLADRCQSCSQKGPHPWSRGENHYAWKGDAARSVTKRQRASNYNRQGECERCGKPGYDKHHRDGDPGNNDPRNVEWLCRRCHMVADGRLARFLALPKTPPKHPTPCWICGTVRDRRRWHGRCHACNEYIRRNPNKERSVYLLSIGRSMESS